MKKLLLTLGLAAVAAFADAQGTIQFANNAGTRFCVGGVIPLSYSNGGPVGGTYYFGVFAGATADHLASQPVLPLFTNSSTGGLISGPNAQAYQIPGFDANAIVFLQIRMWESRFPNWETGQAGLHGATAVRSVVLGPASGPGTVIWSSTDLTKFQGICIPEPSTALLASLGLASFLLFRRRKRTPTNPDQPTP